MLATLAQQIANSGVVESDQVMSETEEASSDGTGTENTGYYIDSEDSCNLLRTSKIPSEEELEQMDWETFYSTGELFKIGERREPIQVTELRNCGQINETNVASIQTNPGGWKKRVGFPINPMLWNIGNIFVNKSIELKNLTS